MTRFGDGLPGALLAGGALVIVLVLFFSEALPRDRVLAPSDMIFETPFYQDAAPEGFTRASNPLLGDQAYQFVPWRRYWWQRMRSGEVPHWNPLSYAGTPFLASMQSASFYPPHLPLLLLPFERGFLWSALLKLWVAGFGTYLLLRRYRLGWIASLYGALAFALSGFLIAWLGHPHTNVLVWLPAILLATELLVTARNGRHRLALVGLLGLVAGIAILGGHPESVLNAAFVSSLYVLVRSWQISRAQGRLRSRPFAIALGAFASGWLLAAGVAAVQLLPFFEWLSVSNELASRAGGSFSWWTSEALDQVLSLLVALFPNMYNNPTWEGPYWSFLFRRSNYNEMALYTGVLTIGLAVLSWRARRGEGRPWIFAWWLIALVALGRIARIPPFEWLNGLPVLSLVRPGRLRIVLSLAICVLAAFGLDAILRDVADRAPDLRWMRRFAVLPILMGMAMMLGGMVALPRLRERIVAMGRGQVDAAIAAQGSARQPMEVYYAEVEGMVDGLLAAFHPANVAMYAPMWIALLSALGITLWLRARGTSDAAVWLGGAALGLLLVDLLAAGRGYNPVVSASDFYPTVRVASRLEAESSQGRVVALQQDLLPDAHMMHGGDRGWREIRGLDYPTRWTRAYLDAMPEAISWLPYGAIVSGASSDLARLPNLQIVMSARRDELEALEGVEEIIDAPPMHAAILSDPVPRAFLARDVLISDDSLADVVRLAEEAGGLRDTVVVSTEGLDEAALGAIEDLATRDTAPSLADARVSILEDQPERLVLQTRSPMEALLFVSDAFYPGWVAFVDGERRVVHRAHHAFRGVIVPAGEHEVVLRYEPTWFTRGLWLSLASSLLAIAMIALGARPLRDAGDATSAA